MSQITHLYIKTHNATGLKYFGKTTSKDPFKYSGSGKYWLRHLKSHGKDISTKIVASFTKEQKEEMVEFALFFSEFFNIVESNEWANLEPENGINGGSIGRMVSKETKQKMSKAKQNMSKETKLKLSIAHKGKIVSKETKQKMSKIAKKRFSIPENNSMFGKNHTKESKLKMSKNKKGKPSTFLGKQHSDETKQKMSKARQNISEETRLKISVSAKNRPKIKCQYCNKEMAQSSYNRWHGKKCKFFCHQIPLI